MANLPLTDPALAKQVWETMANPSTRRVARKLRQAGSTISHMTVARWRNQGWRPLETEQEHPLEAARAALDDAVPVLTGDPLTTANSIVKESADRETLEQLTDAELRMAAASPAPGGGALPDAARWRVANVGSFVKNLDSSQAPGWLPRPLDHLGTAGLLWSALLRSIPRRKVVRSPRRSRQISSYSRLAAFTEHKVRRRGSPMDDLPLVLTTSGTNAKNAHRRGSSMAE